MNYEYPTVEVIDLSAEIRVRIEYDQDPMSPMEWDNIGQIAYCSRRETLGTENVSQERLHEIAAGIEDGSLLGLAVYAYVHSGVTIRCAPFSCPWDSGQSGFVYCTREDAIKNFGKKLLTKKVRERALKCLEIEVDTFDQYLRGDVYGFVVERRRDPDDDDWDCLDSCCGFYGLEYAIEEGKSAGAYHVDKVLEEENRIERETEAFYAGM